MKVKITIEIIDLEHDTGIIYATSDDTEINLDREVWIEDGELKHNEGTLNIEMKNVKMWT